MDGKIVKLKERDRLELINHETDEKYRFLIAQLGKDESGDQFVELFSMNNQKSVTLDVIQYLKQR